MKSDKPTSADAKICRRACAGRCIFLASLLLNFILLGVLICPVISAHVHAFMPPTSERFIDRMTKVLLPEDAAIMHKIYAAEEPAIEQSRAIIKTDVQKVSSILQQATPDQAELQRTLDEIMTERQKIHRSIARIIKNASAELSAEGRQALAKHGLLPPK